MDKKTLPLAALKKLVPLRFRKSVPVVHVIQLTGAIGMGSPIRPGLSLSALEPLLSKAFSRKGLAGVAIVVNSPGGSPVQSALIHDRIRQLAAENKTPVFTFCEDVAASGGYWLALSGDEIYAANSSIIGSIGVISAGFGFVDAIDKLGIERRVHTAGSNKLLLDPFQPLKKADVTRLKAVQSAIHDEFKTHVINRRSDKLDEKSKAGDMFTGAFWTGQQALDIGLIDGLGHMNQVLEDKFGDDLVLKPISRSGGFARRFSLPGSNQGLVEKTAANLGAGLGAAAGEEILTAMETRALWQRYGL